MWSAPFLQLLKENTLAIADTLVLAPDSGRT